MAYLLIDDTPVDTSSHGAHDKLATAIANQIQANEKDAEDKEERKKANTHYNCIALYGQWGSGKSSVVEMLAKKLGTTLIEFDMWNYTGDMLRRSFLSKLVDTINSTENPEPSVDTKNSTENDPNKKTPPRLLKDKRYKFNPLEEILNPASIKKNKPISFKLKEIILGNCQLTETQTPPNSNPKWQHIFILSIFLTWLTVIGVVPLLKVEEIGKIFNANIEMWFFGSIACFFVLWYFSLRFSSVLRSLSMNKISLSTMTGTSQTATIQSQDMGEELFNKIYEFILTHIEDSKIKYLICLDNIDRMGIEHASAILDELNVFLKNTRGKKYIYIVVPIDDTALSDVIKYYRNKNHPCNSDNDASPNTENIVDTIENKDIATNNKDNISRKDTSKNINNNDSLYGDDNFIHKLFPISFRLPDMSNFEWQKFLYEKLKNAGINNKDSIIASTFYTCSHYRLYEEMPINSPYLLTPRDIIYYVNTLVTTFAEVKNIKDRIANLEIQDSIPIEDIAWYVGIIQFNKKTDYTKWFSAKQDITKSFLKKLTSKQIENLYRIHYQTDTPYEVLYRDRLIKAINSKNNEDLEKIKSEIPSAAIKHMLYCNLDIIGTFSLDGFILLSNAFQVIFDKKEYSEFISVEKTYEALKSSLNMYCYPSRDSEGLRENLEFIKAIIKPDDTKDSVKDSIKGLYVYTCIRLAELNINSYSSNIGETDKLLKEIEDYIGDAKEYADSSDIDVQIWIHITYANLYREQGAIEKQNMEIKKDFWSKAETFLNEATEFNDKSKNINQDSENIKKKDSLIYSSRAILYSAQAIEEVWDKGDNTLWSDAKKCIKSAIENNRELSFTWADWADSLLRKAEIRENEQDRKMIWKMAEEYYKCATDIDSNYAKAWTGWAKVLNVQARIELDNEKKIKIWKKVNECYEKAIELEPKNAITLNYWFFSRIFQGYANVDNRDALWKEADTLYKKSIDLDRNSARTQRNYAIFHTYKGRAEKDPDIRKNLWEQADGYYEKAKDSDPTDAETWYNWSKLLELQAEHSATEKDKKEFKDKANNCYKEARKLDASFLEFMEDVYGKA